MDAHKYSFKVSYAVQIPNEEFHHGIKRILESLKDVESYTIDSSKQQVMVEGPVSPSKILSSFQKLGLTAIVRGSGEQNASAVCILEDSNGCVAGLVRMIEVNKFTFFDVSVNKEIVWTRSSQFPLFCSVYASGDISRGLESIGKETLRIGELKDGNLEAWLGVTVADLIGRSIAVRYFNKVLEHEDCLVGVVARSAALWQNDKRVCSCTGKTLWEEATANTKL